jgi:hypothetical protein
MQDLTHQRCYHHQFREAVARCPECGRFFCRECITEHADKVLCASCLGKTLGPDGERLNRFQWLFRLGHFFLGLMILYIFFIISHKRFWHSPHLSMKVLCGSPAGGRDHETETQKAS